MKFKVGDKVVPVNKTHGCKLDSSLVWKEAKRTGQNFLYVVKVDNSGVYSCNADKQNDYGDWYNESDLAPYKKSKNQRIVELEEIAKHFRSELDRAFEIEKDLIKRIESLEFVLAEKSKFSRTATLEGAEINIKPFLTPNQQRAEIIEKAKKFVDETVAYGRSSNRYKSEGNSTYRSNFYDVDFFVKGNKVTAVIYWLRRNVTRVEKPEHVGRAKCAPGDVFNEHIGKAIALGRALDLDVSEFEQVVQPTEYVIGHFVNYDSWMCNKTINLVEVDGNIAVTGEGKKIKLYDTEYGHVKIINDTNAIYEGENK